MRSAGWARGVAARKDKNSSKSSSSTSLKSNYSPVVKSESATSVKRTASSSVVKLGTPVVRLTENNALFPTLDVKEEKKHRGRMDSGKKIARSW